MWPGVSGRSTAEPWLAAANHTLTKQIIHLRASWHAPPPPGGLRSRPLDSSPGLVEPRAEPNSMLLRPWTLSSEGCSRARSAMAWWDLPILFCKRAQQKRCGFLFCCKRGQQNRYGFGGCGKHMQQNNTIRKTISKTPHRTRPREKETEPDSTCSSAFIVTISLNSTRPQIYSRPYIGAHRPSRGD